jgi:thiosulfate/3-mercaptopyruvate sulfurtransferase
MFYQTLVSCDALLRHLTDPNWIVVDCRFSLSDSEAGRRAYEAGHIPGARYAHLDHDLSGSVADNTGRHPLPDSNVLCSTLGDWGITPHSQVVVYDDAGGAVAGRLWWLLRWLGHQSVALLDGGWQAWQMQDRPQSQVAPVVLPSRYPGSADWTAWLDSAEVRQELDDQSILLIDARAAERFRGEIEPIDPIAGHVPGAVNRPLQLNLNQAGYFKNPDQLRAEFEDLLAGRPATEVVHMCGSGVTACHNLLAMEIAGLCGSRLYAGSWSEWLRDPHRPVINREMP